MNKLFPAIVLFCMLAQPSLADGARTSVAAIEKHFMEGKYDTVISESRALIGSGYGKKDELYYIKGLSELKSNKFADARASFSYIIAKCSWSDKLFDANIGVGDSYMLEGDNAKAISVYNDIAERFSTNKNLSVVYGRLSLCNSRMGASDKASSYHDMARNSSPLSFEAKEIPAPGAMKKSSEKAGVSAAVSGDERYSVQAGSFSDKRNAERLARKLTAKGYKSYVSMPVSSDDTYYRVKVGRFSAKSEAQKLASKLRSDGYRTSICTDNVCE